MANTYKHEYKYTKTNTQIHKYKYANTQMQHITKWLKYPTYAIFLNSWWFKDVKNDILKCPKCSEIRSLILEKSWKNVKNKKESKKNHEKMKTEV